MVPRANDYSSTDSSSPWKAILLNKVVVGKGYKILNDNPGMTGPPAGYDSVSGATLHPLDHFEANGYRSPGAC